MNAPSWRQLWQRFLALFRSAPAVDTRVRVRTLTHWSVEGGIPSPVYQERLVEPEDLP